MRKTILIFLAFLLMICALAFTGCSTPNTNLPSPPANPPGTQQGPTSPPAGGGNDDAESGDEGGDTAPDNDDPNNENPDPVGENTFNYRVLEDPQTCAVTGFKSQKNNILTIPNTIDGYRVVRIDANAFSNKSITSLAIPDSITVIGEFAFNECRNLTGVSFGENSELVRLESAAFQGCEKLASFQIPKTVTYIGDFAFSTCQSLVSIEIPSGVTALLDRCFAACTSLTSIEIPNTVMTIDDRVFGNCTALTAITLPDSITSIGHGAFQNCTGLSSITIPDSVTRIGQGAFENCFDIMQTEGFVSYIDGWAVACHPSATAVTVRDGTRGIATDIFSKCESLESVTLPFIGTMPDGRGSDQLRDLFHYRCSLKAITFTGGSMLPDETFSNDDFTFSDSFGMNLVSVTLPDTLTAIGNKAFAGCANLTYINLSELTALASIGEKAFFECEALVSITLPNSVTTIGREAFGSCTGLTTINIPTSLQIISESTFEYCTALSSITIPENVTAIEARAFSACFALSSIELSQRLTSIGDGAFDSCGSLTSIIIPSSVTFIGARAFWYCDGLTDVTLPFIGATPNDTVNTKLYYYTFFGCNNLKNVVLTNCTFIGESAFFGLDTLVSVTLPNSITHIGKWAFMNTALTEISIPDSVTVIGEEAFCNCKSLASVQFGKNALLTRIETRAFADCPSLASITVPDGVTEIGASVFSGCDGLTHITLPFIGSSAVSPANTDFAYIGSPFGLKSVTLTGGTVIAANAFKNCVNLISIALPETIEEIGSAAFMNCINLVSITIPTSVKVIGDQAFHGCYKLIEIENLSSLAISQNELHGGVGSYAQNIYTAAAGASKLVFDDNYIFYCDGATNYLMGYAGTDTALTLPADCRGNSYEIHAYAFSSGSYHSFNDFLISVTIPAKVTKIGAHAFESCMRLQTVTVTENSLLTLIGECAFKACSKLTEFDFKSTLQSYAIDSKAFSECSGLTAIDLPAGLIKLSENVFTSCSSLTAISLPKGVTHIGEGAFFECTALVTVNLPESITHIDSGAFGGCTSLLEITLPSTLTYLGENAFYNCTNLIQSESGILYVDNWVIGYEKGLNFAVIRPSTVGIASYAFYSSSVYGGGTLLSVTIPASMKHINSGAFVVSLTNLIEVCNLSDLPISAGSEEYGGVARYAHNIYTDKDGQSHIFTDKNGYVFYASSTERYLIGYIGTDANLILPADCKGQTYGIYAFAFCNFSSRNDFLTSVTIPASVTKIGEFAFGWCKSLTAVYFSGASQLAEIDANAFFECSSLSTLNLPENLKRIGEDAFYGCDKILILENGIYYVDNWAIGGSSLESLIIRPGTLGIADSAFYDNKKLLSVTIPESVKYMGKSAFLWCNNLSVVNISSLSAWCNIVFCDYSNPMRYGADDIKLLLNGKEFSGELALPNGITKIPDYTFRNCTNITSIFIPNSVTEIGLAAFLECNSVEQMTLPYVIHCTYNGQHYTHFGYMFGGFVNLNYSVPASLKSIVLTSGTVIEPKAFKDMTNLVSITLPDSITTIGSEAFDNCENLSFVYLSENSQLTVIEDNAFDLCVKLTTVIIPKNVTKIGSWAHYNGTDPVELFYGGSEADWGKIEFGESAWYISTSATRYYYSQNPPTTAGNYWHYVDGKPAKWQAATES